MRGMNGPKMAVANLSIRRANPSDAEALAVLHVQAWQWAYRGQLPDAYLDSLSDAIEHRVEWRRAALENVTSEYRTWVAEIDGRVVGFADTGPPEDGETERRIAKLFTIYLDETVVGQGAGRALLAHAMDDLVRRGYREAILWVLDSNVRARRFYEAAGWYQDGAAQVEQLGDVEIREVRYRRILESRS